jgi:hypothetical protein
MRIVGITDIHGRTSAFDQTAATIRSADLVLVSGDITHFGGGKEAAHIIQRLRELNPRVYGVSGNCDQQEVSRYLDEHGLSLEGACVRESGVVLAGAGGSLAAPMGTPNEFSEQEFERILEGVAGCIDGSAPWILVIHQPPLDTANDLVGSGLHVGSTTVRSFIERYTPAVCMCGHIHEGVGIDRIGDTYILNPGPFRHGSLSLVEFDRGELHCVSIMQDGRVVESV